MNIHSLRLWRKKKLKERLVRKRAELAKLNEIYRNTASVSASFVDKVAKLSGEVAELEYRLSVKDPE